MMTKKLIVVIIFKILNLNYNFLVSSGLINIEIYTILKKKIYLESFCLREGIFYLIFE
jgi:hypothetical protein